MGGASLFRVGDAVELWRVLLHLSILVVCLLAFERALHQLERRVAVSAKYERLLSKAYRELMILGLLGLGLKLVKEVPSGNGSSAAMTAFQIADLIIFILALALILQTICIFLLLRQHNVRADRAELLSTEDVAETLASSPSHQSRDLQELVHLRLMRHLFLSRFALPQLFPFAKYLRQTQNNQITHMIDVSAPMWVLLLIVAWILEALAAVLHLEDPSVTERRALVLVLVAFAWILLLLHVAVHWYFRSCVRQLLVAASFVDDRHALEDRLRVIAREEARAWSHEDAGDALVAMQKVQEQHEAIRQLRHRHPHQRRNEVEAQQENNVKQGGTPAIQIRWFSRKAWHFMVVMLLMFNGFYMALVVQCVAYQLGIVSAGSVLVEILAIPLPLVLNTLLLQPRIFRNFVLVCSIFHVDGATLSEVVNHFREIVELRSEFAISLWRCMQARKLSIGDVQAELQARDPSRTGTIDVEKLRVVLRAFGLHLSSFRFNSVARLLFELKDMQVEYAQVLRLISLAQSEVLTDSTNGHMTMVSHHHPLLQQSVLGEEEEKLLTGPSTAIPQSFYSLPEFLVGTPGPAMTEGEVLDAGTTKEVPPPPRPLLKRSESKFQGTSSRALRGLFHIDSEADLDVGAASSDTVYMRI
ncbi:hypothetical protein BBJ28_00008089 [Nothophytophthora sp. Chile5]|nr:hypothetical protein BBJ28_00008089 [Nothophytophthora sp. Chile5]